MDVFFDGACSPRNPGGYATCGVAIFEPVRVVGGASPCLMKGFSYVGKGEGVTNNSAEYRALLLALLALKLLPEMSEGDKERIHFYGDSLLVVNQVKGLWRSKSASLARLLRMVRVDMCPFLGCHTPHDLPIRWVPREDPRQGVADSLSRIAYQEARRNAQSPFAAVWTTASGRRIFGKPVSYKDPSSFEIAIVPSRRSA